MALPWPRSSSLELEGKLWGSSEPGEHALIRRGRVGVLALRCWMLLGCLGLTPLLNITQESGKVPGNWHMPIALGPLFGTKRMCSKHWGITQSLCQSAGKQNTSSRRRNNADCGPKTVNQLFTLARILDGEWVFTYPVDMCFVDCKKAHDHNPWGVLWGPYGSMG